MKCWFLLVVGMLIMLLGPLGCKPCEAQSAYEALAIEQVPTLADPATCPAIVGTVVAVPVTAFIARSAGRGTFHCTKCRMQIDDERRVDWAGGPVRRIVFRLVRFAVRR